MPPTDIYKTLAELNIIFQLMVIEMLGFVATGSPADYSEAAYTAVRVSWPTGGAPAWKVSDDVAFIRVTEDDDLINRQRDVEITDYDTNNVNEEVTYTRVMALHLVFYGPNSYDHAQTVRDEIFSSYYRGQLEAHKIYPLPDIVAPKRNPEPFQGQWWERVDMEIRFNEGISKNKRIGLIKEAIIGVYANNGIDVIDASTE